MGRTNIGLVSTFSVFFPEEEKQEITCFTFLLFKESFCLKRRHYTDAKTTNLSILLLSLFINHNSIQTSHLFLHSSIMDAVVSIIQIIPNFCSQISHQTGYVRHLQENVDTLMKEAKLLQCKCKDMEREGDEASRRGGDKSTKL